MKALVTTLAVACAALVLVGTPAGAGGPDKACSSVVHEAGDWGKGLNPGRAAFIAGTPGADEVPEIPEGVVYCGLGGNDHIGVNRGWFYGGPGMDQVDENYGFVRGGDNTDTVGLNAGTFHGGPEAVRDIVHTNTGFFDGGPGDDLVDSGNSGFFDGGPGLHDTIEGTNVGTCVNVEIGCPQV